MNSNTQGRQPLIDNMHCPAEVDALIAESVWCSRDEAVEVRNELAVLEGWMFLFPGVQEVTSLTTLAQYLKTPIRLPRACSQ
jgi:hypothetical protein